MVNKLRASVLILLVFVGIIGVGPNACTAERQANCAGIDQADRRR